MSDKLSELHFDPASTSPRVDELIAGVMKRFPGVSASAQARYYEEVHQHLAPLARELEAENARLRADAASPAPASTWPGYKRGFSDGRRAAERIHAQRAAPAADTEQLAEARKLIAHASEFAMMQLDDAWHERAAALLALPAPVASSGSPAAPGDAARKVGKS
ncbi:hypothetical protein [Burkholderia plantarii]|uniref:hypothetical protein n=1 Tax=Burkholderia plantarii TaxID=41899 RepID=UPI0008709F1F|nr:hypothetical protein [Burkholderia plantarii]